MRTMNFEAEFPQLRAELVDFALDIVHDFWSIKSIIADRGVMAWIWYVEVGL